MGECIGVPFFNKVFVDNFNKVYFFEFNIKKEAI
jgi:hypothetical protein